MEAPNFAPLVAGRPLWIWGAMIVGQGIARSMERHAIPIAGFLDSNPALQGECALGYPIVAPQTKIESARNGQTLIVVAAGHYEAEIMGSLQSAGLTRDREFVLSGDLIDVMPAIDVAGICNLHCISCPRGNMEKQPPAGMMPLADYTAVLDKLLLELPYLGCVQLYVWGEPLLNRDLPAMIEYTRRKHVLTALSSNLNQGRILAEVVAARPDWFKVSCSGFGPETYEITHTGGRWETFLANLRELARLRDELHPTMQITLSYHLYRHNGGETYRSMEALCRELRIIFRPSPAYLYPMDTVRDYVEKRPLTSQAEQTLPLLLMPLDEGIERARTRTHLACPETCLPINWDRRVRFCGVYFRPFIAEDFLTTPLSEILAKRRSSAFCRDCMKDGLHQFTAVYLAEQRLEIGEDS